MSESIEDKKAVIRRFVEEVQNKHNIDAVDELFDASYVDYTGPPDRPPGIEGVKQACRSSIAAFPDLKTTIHDLIVEGDSVVCYKTMGGTQQGEYAGIPPTGKHVTWDVIDIMPVVNGKITGHWAVSDRLNMMKQLRGI